MRRYINILFLAITLTILGCSKTTIIDVYEAESIKFSAFIDRSTTRGEVTTIKNVSTLSLDAYLSGEQTWESRLSSEPYIDDATLTIAENGSISCDVEKKWPDNSGNLSFFSYAPKSCNTISIIDPTTSDDLKLEYTADDQPSAQSDLIFAASRDLNSNNSSDGVTLTYDHILTKVGFSARTRFDYEEPVVLNSIKIQYGDKIHNQGLYTFDNIEGVWGWSLNDSFHSNVVSEELVIDPAGVVLSDEPKAISAEDKFLMLIPQKIEDLKAIIEYTNGYGEHLTASTIIPTCTLFAGRQYTYCLSVFTDELVFEPAVEDPWGDGDDLNITLEIWNEQQLASIGHSEKYPLNVNYILMADLDLKNNYDGTWTPIEGYTGMFNGNDKSISNPTNVIFNTINSGGVKNLTIATPSFIRNNATSAALVGTLVSSKIENCGVVGGNIESNVTLGGVVGLASNSTISGCYNSCRLNSSSVIGGIVGELRGESNKIMGCYNSAQITCNDDEQTTHSIGGIVGSVASGEIISCYNTGIIHIDDRDNSKISSIVGSKGAGVTTTSCYYQMGAALGIDGESFRSLSELNDAVEGMNSSIADNGGSSSFTKVGESNIPNLRGESTATYAKVIDDSEWPIFGSEDMYNSITAQGKSYATYRLMVNMRYTSRTGNAIGTSEAPFVSTLEGDDKLITGLQIGSESATTPQGLFSYTRSGASIKDLTLTNIKVSGATLVGAVAGDSAGTELSNCSVESSNISGTSYVGGYLGQQVGGSIADCSIASSSVSGSDYVGGVVGHLNQGAIASCEAATTLTATAVNSFAGGVVGLLNNGSELESCSVTSGLVSSATGGLVGGIVGRNSASSISESEVVSGVSVEGVQSVGGVAGDVVSGTITASKSAADVEASTDCVGGIAGYMHYSSTTVQECELTGGSVKGRYYAGGITGVISSANMKNCAVSGGAISGVHSVGGLFGASQVTAGVPQASDCRVSNATVTSSDNFAGGAAGQINAGELINCSISATVSGRSFIGGVVGSFYNGGVIDGCTSQSTVSGDLTTVAAGYGQCVGGVAGQAINATIKGSSMTGGEVKGQLYVGGVSGYSGASDDYSTPTLVEGCSLVAGKVSGTTCVGGILGAYSAGELTQSNMNGGEVSGTQYVGGVLGSTVVSATLSGCNTTGGSISGQYNIGGVFGGVSQNFGGSMTIAECDATGGSVSGVTKVGGITGSDDNTNIFTITKCDSRANVSASTGNVGGVIGQAINKQTTIKYCTYGTGTVSGISKCGGIVGQYLEATTQYCKVLDGVVSGTNYVGGIAGNVEYGAQLLCCSNNANVKGSATGGSCIGGVAGLAAYYSKSGDNSVATIHGCFNTGYVEAPKSNNVGGIVGRGGAGNANPVYIRACYNACYRNNVSIYGNSKVGGIAGLDNKGGLHMHGCYNYSPIFVSNFVNKERGGYILGSKATAGWDYTVNCCYMHIYLNGKELGNAAGGFANDSDLSTHTATSIQGYNDYVVSLNNTIKGQLPNNPELLFEQGNPTASATPTLVWERTVTW